jgi:hypothetical protein
MTQEEGLEINLVRLLLASIQSNGNVSVKIEDYMSPELDKKSLFIEVNEEEKTFIISLVEGDQNESRPDGETSASDSEE